MVMRESILTIPVSESFESKCGCPICRMRDTLEKRTVEYIMGAAMMEPDIRIETNKLGFCKDHYNMMLKQKNRLSLALMLQTHIDEVEKSVFSKKKLFEPKNAKQKKLTQYNSTCFVCEKVNGAMDKLYRTFFEVYLDNDFRKLFLEQEYICLPHYELLCSIAPNYLQKANLERFYEDCALLSDKYMKTLYEDVSHFCSMYDYRNSGKDADWGNSKDSIERAILFLTSR